MIFIFHIGLQSEQIVMMSCGIVKGLAFSCEIECVMKHHHGVYVCVYAFYAPFIKVLKTIHIFLVSFCLRVTTHWITSTQIVYEHIFHAGYVKVKISMI